jgi:5-hydroxyisourate hydrolase
MSTVTTHVLDTSRGRPATGVAVRLERVTESGTEMLAWAATDGGGRIAELGPDDLPAGHYRLVFGTGDYFGTAGQETFYPSVTVDFDLADPDQHYHVPLLLSPHGFTTYRGS